MQITMFLVKLALLQSSPSFFFNMGLVNISINHVKMSIIQMDNSNLKEARFKCQTIQIGEIINDNKLSARP